MPSPPSPTVEIRRGRDGELMVRFPFDWSIIELIRRVPGRRWREREGHWTIPARVAPLLLFLSSLDLTGPPRNPVVPGSPTAETLSDSRWGREHGRLQRST